MSAAAQNKLATLTKDLRADWEQTKQYWNDAKSQEFEKRFLSELIAGVNQAIANIDTVEKLLAQIRRDCE